MARILIIEDDPLISRMYQRVFEFEGYEVDMARDGEEGLGIMKKKKPTLIMLDVMMPKMSGVDVLKEIKAIKDFAGIPVITLTNLSGMKDAEKMIELGAVKYIVKSNHKPKQIVAEVKEILKATTRNEIPDAAEH